MVELIEACKRGDLASVIKLVEEGHSVDGVYSSLSVYAWTPLMEASIAGHCDIVKYLLEQNAIMSARDSYGKSALHHAYVSENGSLDIVNMLISKGADIEAEDHDGWTPLMIAAVKQHHSVLEVLISSGASLNKKNKKGHSALDYACRNGHLDIVNMLISKGADFEAEGQDGLTPLMRAAERGHHSLVELLISSEASINKKNKEGRTALHYACENGHLHIVDMLISKRANIESEDQDGYTPLIRAAKKGYSAVVEVLISSGASVNKKNTEGRTAFHYACEYRYLDIINMLISKGANFEAEDCNSFTPLMIAAARGHQLVMEVLISSGASLDKKNEEGGTALDYAARASKLESCYFLIEAGADMSIISKESQAVLLHQAAKKGLDSQLKTLLLAGAPVNHKDGDGRTAQYYAAEAQQINCVCLLIEAGADISLISKKSLAALMHQAVDEGLDSQLKTLIIAGAPVNHRDGYGRTALYYAAEHNHIQCGILLVEGGVDIQIKGINGQTQIDNASPEFKAAVEQTLSFTSKKTICVIGNACSGKSTLIASLQNEKAPFFKKFTNRIFGVEDIRKRTAGIEPVYFSSKRYGNVAMFDFAGQHEYHGPHEMFLESILTKTGSTVTIILVVKVTESKSVISRQLYRWLTPISKMSSSSSPVRVIVVGSFLDKVEVKAKAQENLSHCYQRIREDFKDPAMEYQGTCLLNCRQPYYEGINQLCQWLDDVPTPLYKATDTLYSISWVISRINHTFDQEAIKLIDLAKWMNDNKADLPTNLPSAEVVCSDLSATGHFLYLPNKVDLSKGWLILDLAAILHNVYGKIFSPFKKIVDQFGLLKCLDLQQLFSTLDGDMIRNVLIALEFCIEVDPTLLSKEIRKLKGSEKEDFLFFPALVSANPPEKFPDLPASAVIHTLCWQLQADEKHFISPRLMQTAILRLAAHHVFHYQLGRNTKEHCCNVWQNGISWQSPDGVDVAVQISDNALVQVLGRSIVGPDVLCQYISEITSDIITTVLQILLDFSATSYIIRSSDPISLLKVPKSVSANETFPVSSVLSIMKDCKEFCLSRPDQSGQSARLPVSDLFSGVQPSRNMVQKLCFHHFVHDGDANQNGPLFATPTVGVGTTVPQSIPRSDRVLTTPTEPIPTPELLTREVETNKTQTLLPPVEYTKDTEITMDPPSSPPTLGGCPSESDLSKVLDIIPEWYDLAVALGVPVERVEHFQRIKTGGIEALCYWRCGESEQNHPTSWRFLLDKIEECHGQDVVRDMKKVFSNLSDFQPGDFVEEYKDQFLSCIDAHAIVRKLDIHNVIPDTVSHKIENSAPSVANEVLFLHLRSHSSSENLHKLCDVMISMSGYPNMNELGRAMKEYLSSV